MVTYFNKETDLKKSDKHEPSPFFSLKTKLIRYRTRILFIYANNNQTILLKRPQRNYPALYDFKVPYFVID